MNAQKNRRLKWLQVQLDRRHRNQNSRSRLNWLFSKRSPGKHANEFGFLEQFGAEHWNLFFAESLSYAVRVGVLLCNLGDVFSCLFFGEPKSGGAMPTVYCYIPMPCVPDFQPPTFLTSISERSKWQDRLWLAKTAHVISFFIPLIYCTLCLRPRDWLRASLAKDELRSLDLRIDSELRSRITNSQTTDYADRFYWICCNSIGKYKFLAFMKYLPIHRIDGNHSHMHSQYSQNWYPDRGSTRCLAILS